MREIDARRRAFQAERSFDKLAELVDAIADEDEAKVQAYSLLAQRAFYEKETTNGAMVRDL